MICGRPPSCVFSPTAQRNLTLILTLTFDLLSWKLTHRLLLFWVMFRPMFVLYVFCSRVNSQNGTHGHANRQTNRQADGQDPYCGRRERLAQSFFRHNVLNETSYLHYLLKSQERSQDIVNRLRSSQTYEHYSVPTEKFKRSFIPFSINNYQLHFIWRFKYDCILSNILCSVFITSYCIV